jgi:hypothetical protein
MCTHFRRMELEQKNYSKLTSLLLRSSANNTSTLAETQSTIRINEQILKAEKDFERYLHEKRRLYLVKLIEALTIGAEAHISDEKAKIDHSFQTSFVPSLLRFLSARLIGHAMALFQNEEVESDEVNEFESKPLAVSIDNQILSLLKKYQENLEKALSDHHHSVQERTFDQLSIAFLEQEKHWKEKTIADVQSYHNLKLYEFLVSRSLRSEGEDMTARRTRRSTSASDQVEETHHNVCVDQHQVKLRELNSANILKRFTFSVHNSEHLSEPRTAPRPRRQPHSIEEYYQQAERLASLSSPSSPLLPPVLSSSQSSSQIA